MDRSVGIVAIGRNEGDRLEACLRSALAASPVVVYVDSGSTDGSPARARAIGAEVIELDPARPFTAARGRNEGLARLGERGDLAYVHFVDGDCELVPGWVDVAAAILDEQPEIDVVCGRRRERFPDASPYNALADIEWDTPVGVADACGGDALMRLDRVAGLGGYDETLIAGEDPELCYRIRQAGGRILRVDAEMTRHDANLMHFGAWWRRMVRSGHAYAEFADRYRDAAGERRGRRLRSIVAWGLVAPLAGLVAPVVLGVPGLLATAALPAQALRLFAKERRQRPTRLAALYALSIVIGKIAEAQGVGTYAWRRWRGIGPQLIEYKGPGDTTRA